MPFFENLDFLNSNSVRSYPIKEGLDGASPHFTLPDDFLLDFTISATSDVFADFYISQIFNYPEVVILEISQVGGSSAGTFTITTASHTRYQTYYLAPTAEF